ncbi:MAG: hypothetical protein WA921_13635 [Ahrensia sp.]
MTNMDFKMLPRTIGFIFFVMASSAFAQDTTNQQAEDYSVKGLDQLLDEGDIGDSIDYYRALYSDTDTRADAENFVAELIKRVETRIVDYRGPEDLCRQLPRELLPTYTFNREVPRHWLDIAFLSRVPIGWPDQLEEFSQVIYKEVACLNQPKNSVHVLNYGSDRNQSLRLRLQIIENLLARIPGNYRSVLPDARRNSCADHEQKRADRLELVKKHPASRYAPRALLLATYSTISHAQSEGCDEDEKIDLLNAQVAEIAKSLEADGLFQSSIGSWRFANDLVHFGLVTAYLAGNQDSFNALLARMPAEQQMIDGSGRWVQDNKSLNIHKRENFEPIIRKREIELLEHAVQRLFADTHLPYTDTVYVFQFLPGDDGTALQKSFLPRQFAQFYQNLDFSIDNLSDRLMAVRESEHIPRHELASVILYPELLQEDLERGMKACQSIVENIVPSITQCSAMTRNQSAEPTFDIGVQHISEQLARNLVDALASIQSTTTIRHTPLPSRF